ncbi:(d)CMP kinase [Salisaeta longa]|uniref:(d)CMP kinase n=1 Tax=Salisaeta longa TaxID=503170 RepID=UPI0003B46192|nr:(d)CMP kinase [Salisaeta longa]
MIITIDGPAGSGKSTTARAVATRLSYVYLDTGAMYRAVALAFVEADADPTADAASRVLDDLRVDVFYTGDTMGVRLNGRDVTDQIRTQAVGTMASQISTLQAVREKMVAEQRRLGTHHVETHGGVVLDGRDTGTVVFPEADVKIFMDADPWERARRRKKEQEAEGRSVSLEAVHKEIVARDAQDRTRDIAPLRKAEDAVVLDTTARTIEEQVDFVVAQVEDARRPDANGT